MKPTDQQAEKQYICRLAQLNEIISLRERVLIAGTDRTTPYFDGDDHPATRHYGVFADGCVLGCASLMLSAWERSKAWQLRGMATDPSYQGQGLGRALLRFMEEDILSSSDVWTCWCNARSGAVAFYEKMGWSKMSGEFVIAGVGPHFRMMKRLTPSSDLKTEN